MPRSCFPLALVLFLFASDNPCLGATDRDGDGIPDADEEVLGTDPTKPDVFSTLFERTGQAEARRKLPGYDPSMDVTRLEMVHAGGNRYVWRATFSAPPQPEKTVFHLYVDADAKADTGRKEAKGTAMAGTDYMLTIAGGSAYSTHFDPSGQSSSGPMVSYLVRGNSLLLSADVDLGHDEQGVRYDLFVLCHSLTTPQQRRPSMSDSWGKGRIRGIPTVTRAKIIRPMDYTENHQVEALFGYQQLCRVLVDKSNLVVAHDKLEMEGFEVDLQTSHRFFHVSRTAKLGRVWSKAPRAGRYHVGFMMYDDSNDERVSIHVEGKCLGIAVARQDNNRTWLYWLARPYDFRGGEQVELRAFGPLGRHGICNLLFLPRAPEPRGVAYRVENMTSAGHVGRPGRVTISWTSTWPCPTVFEYGRDGKYGQTISADAPCLAHRVVIEGLDPQVEYHGRARGRLRDGVPFYSTDFSFRAVLPVPPPTRPGVTETPLTVANPYRFAMKDWPICTGVPMPKGALTEAEQVRLVEGAGEVPVQVDVTARWPDGSVKWLLANFQASAPAGGKSVYRFQYGQDVRRAAVPTAITVRRSGKGLIVDTGRIRFAFDQLGNLGELASGGRLLSPPGKASATLVELPDGSSLRPRGPAEIIVEQSGPLRAVVKAVNHLADAKGTNLLRIEKRVEAYHNLATLRIHHTLVVVAPEKFLRIKRLGYDIPLMHSGGRWELPLVAGPATTMEQGSTVWQRFDGQWAAQSASGEKVVNGRLAGALLGDDRCGTAVALRDLWQNYPAGFSLRNGSLEVSLCPPLSPGLYDQFPFEKEGNQLYYYLLGGHYRLKQGVSKTHEMYLCFEPAGRAELCQLFQRPPLATADPAWYCSTRVFYDVAPRDPRKFKLYEESIDRNLRQYAVTRERMHDYGMLNYGDWFGERGANWGNVEYDTQHAFFLEYIRSGNPDAFSLGESTELHNRDVDTIHWQPGPGPIGGVYIHQMSHVGGYFDKGVEGTLAIPSAGCSVSHAWAEGHFDHFFLTGDRRSYETGCTVADYFVRQGLGRPYDFLGCREPGWFLIMLAAAYAATDDPYYLNAARVVVERVLETQDTSPRPLPDHQARGRQPYQLGTWSRMMVPGHCQCVPRHRGNAGFMVAVLLSGLKYYYDVIPDPRVRQCLILGARGLLDETYSDEVKGFRYTSCPNTRYSPGASPLMVEGVARAHLWTRDERFRRVLAESLPLGAGGSGYGKGFSMYYRMAPRVLADLDAAGLTLDKR